MSEHTALVRADQDYRCRAHQRQARMQPWKNIHAVTTLDAKLHTYGLTPTAAPGW